MRKHALMEVEVL